MRHLLYCINRSYVEQMMVSLSSVLRHGQLGPLDVHIINRDLTQEDKMRISLLSSSSCHISFIHFDEDRLQGSPTSSRYPLEIYFRLFSPILLPNEVDRILDKISEKGFASLTESERQTLVDARRRMK